MGTNVSSVETSSFQESIVDGSLEFLRTNNNVVNTTAKTQQSITIQGVGATFECPPNILQGATLNTQVVNSMSNEEELKFFDFIETVAETSIKNLIEQQNKDLNLLQTNVSVVKNENTLILDRDFSKEIQTEVNNAAQNNFEIVQDVGLFLNGATVKCPDGQTWNIDQEAKINAVVTTAFKNTFDFDKITQIRENLKFDVDNVVAQSNEGIEIPLDLLFLIPIIMMVVLGIVVIIMVLALPWILQKLSNLSLVSITKKSKN